MLNDRDRQTLQLEEVHWRFPAAKEARVMELFGETPTRFYQRLNALLDNPDALAEYPVTVRRLQRLREARRRARRSAAAQFS